MVERQSSKLHTRVRFPSPAPFCFISAQRGISPSIVTNWILDVGLNGFASQLQVIDVQSHFNQKAAQVLLRTNELLLKELKIICEKGF
jgi:hypothetical protein